MIDNLGLALNEKRECPSDSRINIYAHNFFIAHRRAEHPLTNHRWIKPGIKNLSGWIWINMAGACLKQFRREH